MLHTECIVADVYLSMLFFILIIIISDDLAELKYTQWCIKEAIRMYPPVYRIFRKLVQDTNIDGYLIPSGIPV